MDGTNLVEGEFTCQHDSFETQVTEIRHVFGCPVIALGGSMQTNRWKVEVQQMQILNDECIYTDPIQVMRHLHSLRIFLLMKQGVERDQHLHTIGVGILHHFRQILHTVSCCLTCSESRCTDIDRVSTGLNSRLGYLLVTSRSEEAKRYITMPAVTDTFIECFVPYCGISMHWLHLSITSCCTPNTSWPKITAILGQFEI